MEEKKFVVTIGRQFGSGGREIGKLVAAGLNIDYYDQELIVEAAKQGGVTTDYVNASDEKAPSFFSNMWQLNLGFSSGAFFLDTTPVGEDNVYKAQSDAIRALAQRGSCVIVGRTADYVLRNNPNVISVFIHAPIEHCVKRIMSRNDSLTAESAAALAEKKNKLRASYYDFYTDKQWGHSTSYDLCVDSSKGGVAMVANLIIQYVKARLGE